LRCIAVISSTRDSAARSRYRCGAEHHQRCGVARRRTADPIVDGMARNLLAGNYTRQTRLCRCRRRQKRREHTHTSGSTARRRRRCLRLKMTRSKEVRSLLQDYAASSHRGMPPMKKISARRFDSRVLLVARRRKIIEAIKVQTKAHQPTRSWNALSYSWMDCLRSTAKRVNRLSLDDRMRYGRTRAVVSQSCMRCCWREDVGNDLPNPLRVTRSLTRSRVGKTDALPRYPVIELSRTGRELERPIAIVGALCIWQQRGGRRSQPSSASSRAAAN